MSRFNKKGFKTLIGRTKDGNLQPFPVKVGSALDQRNERQVGKLKKERQKAFRDYKKNLREAKKKVPIEERAKTNWSQVPKEYL